MNDFLKKDDYEEPRCLLDLHPEITRINVGRMIEKLDEYLGRNDYDAAERHLRYWLAEAQSGHDDRGELSVRNEQIGLYRKLGKEAECLAAVTSALALVDALEMDDTLTLATTLINAATGYKAFGKAADALPLYEQARAIYEAHLKPDDDHLGGLYNNMALALTEVQRYREAETLFGKALDAMTQQEHGEAEMAITYLNLADLVAAERGLEAGEAQIGEYLAEAERLLDTDTLPQNGYYAFVCEKCAPVFGYYGYFLTEDKLTERAKNIYERS